MTDAAAFGPEQALFPELPAGAFAKQDPGDDLAFYAPPRLVTHIDEAATAALTMKRRKNMVISSVGTRIMPSPGCPACPGAAAC